MEDLYSVHRSYDQVSVQKFLSEEDRSDKILFVTGDPGDGKTSWVKTQLKSWVGYNDLALFVDKGKSINSFDDLVGTIVSSSVSPVELPILSKLAKKVDYRQSLNLFEFCSSSLKYTFIDSRVISDMFLHDLFTVERVWLIIDDNLICNNYVYEWILNLLGNEEKNFRLSLIIIEDEYTQTNYSKISVPSFTVRINDFSINELRTFCDNARNGSNALSVLKDEEIQYITKNKPILVQWLANLPMSWFKKAEGVTLEENIFAFLEDPKKVNIFATIALCDLLDEHLFKTIVSNCLPLSESANWVLNSPLVEAKEFQYFSLHSYLKIIIKNAIIAGNAPYQTGDYHDHLYRILLGRYNRIKEFKNLLYKKNLLLSLFREVMIHGFEGTVSQSIVYQEFAKNIVDIIQEAPYVLIELSNSLENKFGESVSEIIDALMKGNYRKLASLWSVFLLNKDFPSPSIQAKFNSLLGFFHYLNDDYSEASQAFAEALRVNPKDFIAYFGKGLIIQDTHEWNESIREFTLCIENNKEFAPAYNERGAAFFALNNLERAFEDFESAIRVNPNFVHALTNLGILYQQTQNLEQSQYWLQRAFEIDSDETKAYINLLIM